MTNETAKKAFNQLLEGLPDIVSAFNRGEHIPFKGDQWIDVSRWIIQAHAADFLKQVASEIFGPTCTYLELVYTLKDKGDDIYFTCDFRGFADNEDGTSNELPQIKGPKADQMRRRARLIADDYHAAGIVYMVIDNKQPNAADLAISMIQKE